VFGLWFFCFCRPAEIKNIKKKSKNKEKKKKFLETKTYGTAR
jgi:hypothetical protein